MDAARYPTNGGPSKPTLAQAPVMAVAPPEIDGAADAGHLRQWWPGE
jgi:hypothetical protein